MLVLGCVRVCESLADVLPCHNPSQLQARSLSAAAFQLNAKMVMANPDYYSAWNHRREMVQDRMAEG